MEDIQTGPRGGVTTVGPSGWQKTTVYLRPEQVRKLKKTAFDLDKTMSEILRLSIDCYFGDGEWEPRLSEAQRQTVESILREQLGLKPDHLAEVLAALDDLNDRDG
jgi:hypothetical protein